MHCQAFGAADVIAQRDGLAVHVAKLQPVESAKRNHVEMKIVASKVEAVHFVPAHFPGDENISAGEARFVDGRAETELPEDGSAEEKEGNIKAGPRGGILRFMGDGESHKTNEESCHCQQDGNPDIGPVRFYWRTERMIWQRCNSFGWRSITTRGQSPMVAL